MKILIDLTSLADNFSGIERYALNISKSMIEQDLKNQYILIFKNSIHSEFNDFRKNKNVIVRIIKGKNKLLFNQIILPYNLYKIKADKYIFLAFPSPILFVKKGIINTIHDLTAFLYPNTMNKKSQIYFKYSIINAIRRSELILTVSESSRNDIVESFGNINIRVVGNGVSNVFKLFNYNKEINSLVKKEFNLPDSYIMSLGTIEPRKNLRLLVEAYVELRKENLISQKLVLVGRRGWKIDEIFKSLDENIINNDIIFTGFIDDEYLPYIYNNAECFILASIYEGFGIPVIESIAVDTTVIISNIKSLVEITGGLAISFESNNKIQLKEKLVKVINLPKKEKEEVVNKLKSFTEKYQWNIQANKLLDNIKE